MSSSSDFASFGDLDALDMSELRFTLGAMLIGGFVCIFLSGIVTMQVYLYYRVYQRDALRVKVTVFALWLFDVLHSAMVCVTNWEYAVVHFGDASRVDDILWSVAFSIALTAITTFIVHIFFTHRLHAISNSNLYMTAPMVALALLRVAVALVTTVKMIQLGSFRRFIDEIDWVFTMGLSASAVMDVAIAVGLCYFLRKNKSGFSSSMDQLIDSLVLYTVESGVVTCAVTIVSLICWTTMSDNLIFMGLHFTISKLYANSLLATLNSRKSLKIRSQASSDKEHPLPILFPGRANRRGHFSLSHHSVNPTSTMGVEINVQKTIQIDDEIVDGLRMDDSPVASSSDIRKSKGTIS